jgi:hypothetical protein
MNTTLLHFQRNGQPVGSWPAIMVGSLLDRGDIEPDDTWFIEGMTAAEPVSVLVRERAPEVGKVAVTNFPNPPEATPVKFRSANVPFIDVVLVTFKVLLALLIASPAVALVFIVGMGIATAVGVKLLGH